jgi:hypothetical protein
MPIHDWTRVGAGVFHAFHHDWITELSRALNRGLLPPEYYALTEQIVGGLGPDVLTLRRPADDGSATAVPSGGIALEVAPPRVRFRVQAEAVRYAAKAKAVAIRHASNHQVIALLEIASPGNKNSQNGLNAFVRKARDALAASLHLLIADLFPPGARDPQGIHQAVWGSDSESAFVLPDEKPLTCASYVGGTSAEAFVEPMAIGDPLPEMPLFLTPDVYIPVPLETTYQLAWEGLPTVWRSALSSAE